eukprot:TRINITY_DN351_c0_g1_i1.p1 TRINITY_DN351_c0_g1~~TRINITY_DN351_c0_g1_i1.p1  ORF type:complete len:461 (-),score=113.69 TRINITY_DN351_c0_g1_i1:25-1407(-)
MTKFNYFAFFAIVAIIGFASLVVAEDTPEQVEDQLFNIEIDDDDSLIKEKQDFPSRDVDPKLMQRLKDEYEKFKMEGKEWHTFTKEEWLEKYDDFTPEELAEIDMMQEVNYNCFEDNCRIGFGKAILIIGDYTYLGRLLIERFINTGNQVWFITNTPVKNYWPDKFLSIHVVDHVDDMDKFKETLLALGWIDVVIDLEGTHPVHTSTLIETMAGRCEQLIHISSDAVFVASKSSKNQLLLEDDAVRPSEKIREALLAKHGILYHIGDARLGCEELLMKVYEDHKVPITILRVPDIIGEHEDRGYFISIFSALQRGTQIGSSTKGHKKSRSDVGILYAGDFVDAVEAAMERKSTYGKIINLAGDDALPYKEFVQLVATKMRSPPPNFEYSQKAIMPTFPAGAMDNSLAKEILEWTPTPLDVWVTKVVKWFSEDSNFYSAYESLQAKQNVQTVNDLYKENVI